MTELEKMQATLRRRLEDPGWVSRQSEKYERIVGSDRRTPIVLDARSPSRYEVVEMLGIEAPQFDEPETVDELWLDRWQRSSGSYTITRMPDGSVRLDLEDGGRREYKVSGVRRSGFTWTLELLDSGGRRIDIRRTAEQFETEEEALFDMNRAALQSFDEMTNLY